MSESFHPNDPSAGDVDGIPLGQPAERGTQLALCIGFASGTDARVDALLASEGLRTLHALSTEDATRHIVSEPVDLIVVSAAVRAQAFAPVAQQARRIAAATKLVIAGDAPRSRNLLEAIRAGAVDWIDLSEDQDDQASRIRAALELGREERRREQRVARLKGICRKLTVTRDEFARQMDTISDGMQALDETRERLDEAAIAGEFRGLLSQELDVEDLLRTAMQYMLTKTGATNAAVFLPGSKPTQFGLGAYVHYDCPRASAEALLSRLSNDVCPRLAAGDDIVRFSDTAEFVESLGIEASVLDDAELVAWPARHGDECMAVFFLFRNRSEPFRDELAGVIDALRPVFAAQMAKLVRIHHRSRFQWPQAQTDLAGDGDADGESGENEREDDGEGWRKAA